jgi:hypothetical protein
LICDLIRFVVCVYHPTNEVISSDVVPRWAIIAWFEGVPFRLLMQQVVTVCTDADWRS